MVIKIKDIRVDTDMIGRPINTKQNHILVCVGIQYRIKNLLIGLSFNSGTIKVY